MAEGYYPDQQLNCESATKAYKMVKEDIRKYSNLLSLEATVQKGAQSPCCHGVDMAEKFAKLIQILVTLQSLVETHGHEIDDVNKRTETGRHKKVSKSGQIQIPRDSGVGSTTSQDLRSMKINSSNINAAAEAGVELRCPRSKDENSSEYSTNQANIDRPDNPKCKTKRFAMSVEPNDNRNHDENPDYSDIHENSQTHLKYSCSSDDDDTEDAHIKDDFSEKEKNTTRPSDFSEKAINTTKPSDFSEKEEGITMPGDFTEKVKNTTRPSDLIENVKNTARPSDFSEKEEDTTRPGDS